MIMTLVKRWEGMSATLIRVAGGLGDGVGELMSQSGFGWGDTNGADTGTCGSVWNPGEQAQRHKHDWQIQKRAEK